MNVENSLSSTSASNLKNPPVPPPGDAEMAAPPRQPQPSVAEPPPSNAEPTPTLPPELRNNLIPSKDLKNPSVPPPGDAEMDAPPLKPPPSKAEPTPTLPPQLRNILIPSQAGDTEIASPPLQPPPSVAVPPPSTAEPTPTLPPQLRNILIPSKDPDVILSGGGISFLTRNQNARFSYGYSSFKGKRSSMEDFYETSISEVDGQMVAFFGVFDGHGGSRTAEYLKKYLFKNLSTHPDFINDTKSAIVESFRQTDSDYLNEEKSQQKDAGSTASTALLLGDRLLVANVGDSRVVASRAGSAIALSIDHKPDRSDERERIEQAGGFIIWAGTWRVGGVLAVSRAFGDKLLKPYVVAEPEIQEEEIDSVDFIIIASDGLWNVLSNKDAVAIVQDTADAEAASRKLIKEAYAKGSSDNITCLVVRFEGP